jgi:hypothetical protein
MIEEEKLEPASSEKQEQTQKFKPPIRGPDWFDRFFALIQQRRIDSIDRKFVRANIARDPSGASKFLTGLRFLGLINDKGAATVKLESLQLTGDQFRTNLEKVVRVAYKDVFEQIHAKDFTTDNLRNFFVRQYHMGGGFAVRAVYVFQYLARKAGIPLSDSEEPSSLEQETQPKRDKTWPDKGRVPKTRPTKKSTITVPEGVEQLQFGDVRIWLPKGDEKAAQAAKNLIDFYLQSLKQQ